MIVRRYKEDKNPKKKDIRKEFDNDENKPFVQPVLEGNMEYLHGESLMLFGNQTYHRRVYRPFYGIGIVYRVVKGDKFDLLYVRFGCFQNVKTRLVVVWHNHARRQTLTLKRGQCCQVYGICRYFTTEIELNGVKTKGVKLGLYATAINGWYVPTIMDIRKMPANEDLAQPTEKEQALQRTFDDILNDFLNENGEDDQ